MGERLARVPVRRGAAGHGAGAKMSAPASSGRPARAGEPAQLVRPVDGGADALPLVSVIIPAFNEEAFIRGCVQSFLRQEYPPDRLEILVAEGRSSDRTRELVELMAQTDRRVRLVDNPDGAKGSGFNRGVRVARGQVVLWAGAHAEYPPDFVGHNVRALVAYGADAVGGRVETLARDDTVLGRAIALCGASRFGYGAAVFRRGGREVRDVNAVFGGCYRRDLFERVGLIDERLDRGQDREFFERIRRLGGRVLFVPEICSRYYQRSDLRSYVPWLYVCGMTPLYISRITGMRNWSPRNLVPPSFVLALVGLPFLALAWPPFWLPWAAMTVLYGALAVAAALGSARRARDPRVVLALLILFPLTHIVYGLGALNGLVRPIRRGDRWAKA